MAFDLTKELKSCSEISDRLVKKALENGTRDNVSVLVLKFN